MVVLDRSIDSMPATICRISLLHRSTTQRQRRPRCCLAYSYQHGVSKYERDGYDVIRPTDLRPHERYISRNEGRKDAYACLNISARDIETACCNPRSEASAISHTPDISDLKNVSFHMSVTQIYFAAPSSEGSDTIGWRKSGSGRQSSE